MGALWGVSGRLEDVVGRLWRVVGRRGASYMCRWDALGRVVAACKIYYKTAAKTHIMRQRSSCNRL